MPMATLLSVVTLVLTGQPLTPVNVFVILSYINVLRLSTNYYLAYGFSEIYEAYVSLGRIEEYLLLENLPLNAPDQFSAKTGYTERNLVKLESGVIDHEKEMEVSSVHDLNDPAAPANLCVSRLTYKQTRRKGEFILQDVEFITASKSLTVVTGPVGSGKSTLLSAIAGEMADISGAITFQGTIVYVPQIAWVFSGTVRENILFGQPYDEHIYTRVIEACALTDDIQQFPNGDQTIVGERGVVLSGGQRARVSLARAVYVDADLYLLDDPLSAVDFKVGQHIMQKCIKALLGDKTRVLTSHREQHMKDADQVIVLYKGRVLGKGTFTELQGKGILNTTVDPLYNKALMGNKSNNSTAEENGAKLPQTSEVKDLEISDEDRSIGVVSSKLYWDYFRNGIHSLLIIAVLCLCLVTQGKILVKAN